MDHIEWDLLSPLTPEAFAKGLCADIGLSGEAAPLIAHALHEEILKHKKDAIEWGVLGGDAAVASTHVASARPVLELAEDAGSAGGTRAGTRAGSVVAGANPHPNLPLSDKAKERAVTIIAPIKDKLGLGNWGRAPRDGLGRGPRALKSVWRDWTEAEEFMTRFEVLTAEEVERREIERERASRYVCFNDIFLKIILLNVDSVLQPVAERDVKVPIQLDETEALRPVQAVVVIKYSYFLVAIIACQEFIFSCLFIAYFTVHNRCLCMLHACCGERELLCQISSVRNASCNLLAFPARPPPVPP